MKITEYANLVLGKEYLGQSNRQSVSSDVYQDFIDKLSKYSDIKQVFNATNSHAEFFSACKDFSRWTPKHAQKEVFYAAKNGFYSKDVPADCIFLVKLAFNRVSIPNLILKQVPSSVSKTWFAEGYFTGGYTLRDVICTYCAPDYIPISDTNTKVKHNTYTEIYIKSTDMVAAVPNKIGDLLSLNDIENIECDVNGLHIGGNYIRTLGGYYGASNSVYDLRRIV